MPKIDNIKVSSQPCALCGHVYGQLHRLVPGCWDGFYTAENCVWLCPNHHHAIHFVMAWYYCSGDGPQYQGDQDRFEERLCTYMADREVQNLWCKQVKPIVKQRMIDEGRYHPYVRTLPAEPRFVIPR
jgi:hypothetical protein